MSEVISVERQQNRIIVEAIKKIVTNPRTPNWIKNPLESAVKEAKALKPSEPTSEPKKAVEEPEEEYIDLPLEVGCECVDALNPKDKCRYLIVGEGLEIEGVQLYDVKVIKGDEKTPRGVVQINVPATYLRAIKAPQV